jgi:hypothetical protein
MVQRKFTADGGGKAVRTIFLLQPEGGVPGSSGDAMSSRVKIKEWSADDKVISVCEIEAPTDPTKFPK